MITLVTGACGFLGGHMCEVLVQAGHTVRALDHPLACRVDDPRAGVHPSVVRGLGLEPAPLRLAQDADRLPALLDGVTTVFHAGLQLDPAPLPELEEVNVAGTQALIRAATDAGVEQLVLFSSGQVYGRPEEAAFAEGRPLDPCDDVARSQVLAEEAATEATGLTVYVLRTVGVYGPRASTVAGWGGRLVRLARQPVAAAPRNAARRVSLIHVRDVARAALHLVVSPSDPGVYNVTSEDDLTARDLIRRVALLAGKPYVDLPPLPLRGLRRAAQAAEGLTRLGRALAPRRPERLPDLWLGSDPRVDTTRLRDTGFQFEFPEARRGVRDTLTWFKQEGWL